MKTAKEVCEELKNIEQNTLDRQYKELIYQIVKKLGKFQTIYSNKPIYFKELVEKFSVKLHENGFKITEKVHIYKFKGAWPWSKVREIPEVYYEVSVDCECKDENS